MNSINYRNEESDLEKSYLLPACQDLFGKIWAADMTAKIVARVVHWVGKLLNPLGRGLVYMGKSKLGCEFKVY